MMKFFFLFATFVLFISQVNSQDTFSIVAIDPITGEVGSAGASCVDLDAANIPTDDFLGELFPGVGAINTQAYYLPANQINARAKMNDGYTPTEIINWLIKNDVQNQPQRRQYGIVGLVGDNVESAAHTGTLTDDYKGHITGSNYSIQGNIVSGPEVLNAMEQEFLNAEGDLACKLMAAMQGANTVGADTRCTGNNTSSLFAYLKVAQPTDVFGAPSFLVSVRTGSTDQIEPISELQSLFDVERECEKLSIYDVQNEFPFLIYPIPSNHQIKINTLINQSYEHTIQLFSATGKVLYEASFLNHAEINIDNFPRGVYFICITNQESSYSTKWIKK